MRFAQADASDENHVGLFLGEGEAKEILHLRAVNFLGPVPVKLIESFDDGKASGLNASLGRMVFTAQCFPFRQSAQKIKLSPIFLHGFLGQGLMIFAKKGEFEIEQMGQELIVFHRVDS